MPIQTPEELEKVLNVSWYSPDKSREEEVYVFRFGLFDLDP
jgi:hypothetical protein